MSSTPPEQTQPSSQSQQSDALTEQYYNDIKGQDIHNAKWLPLAEGETIAYWGNPSIIPHIPTFLTGVILLIIGVSAEILFYEYIGWWGLTLIPLGITIGILDYVRIISTFYVLTSEKVVYKRGILARNTIKIRYEDIENVRAVQSTIEMIFNYGDIEIATAGTDKAEAYLDNVRHNEEVANIIEQQRSNYSRGTQNNR
jgi:uncharacterized membrane protein YdbT with pleckstrin-like domain